MIADQNERLESSHPEFSLKVRKFKPNIESVARVHLNIPQLKFALLLLEFDF